MQRRGKYQSGYHFIQANLSVTVSYSHLIWPSTCYWSQSKHKSNKPHQSHSALQSSRCASPCNGLSPFLTPAHWTPMMWKAFSFSILAFLKFVHRKFHLLKSNTCPNQFNTRNQFLTRYNKYIKHLTCFIGSCVYTQSINVHLFRKNWPYE